MVLPRLTRIQFEFSLTINIIESTIFQCQSDYVKNIILIPGKLKRGRLFSQAGLFSAVKTKGVLT